MSYTAHAFSRRRFARVVAGGFAIVGLGGCNSLIPGAERDPPKLYDLSPKSTFAPDLPKAHWQLVIETPVAAAGLSSARVALKRTPLQLEYFARVAWTDTAPRMVQTLMVESFENSGEIVSVGREDAGLRSDFVLKTELREFQAEYKNGEGQPQIRVRINAKLVQMPERKIIASKTIEKLIPAEANAMKAIINSFDEALGKTLRALVEWALRAGDKSWSARAARLSERRRRLLFSRR